MNNLPPFRQSADLIAMHSDMIASAQAEPMTKDEIEAARQPDMVTIQWKWTTNSFYVPVIHVPDTPDWCQLIAAVPEIETTDPTDIGRDLAQWLKPE